MSIEFWQGLVIGFVAAQILLGLVAVRAGVLEKMIEELTR
jgi:hypothetical protein